MTRYSDALAPFLGVLFEAENLKNILGSVVTDAGKSQIRMAETEKYPHVTYFLNGVKVNEARDSVFTWGRLLFQSEGAEIYFRRIELHPLKK